jgi:hypothetical protein
MRPGAVAAFACGALAAILPGIGRTAELTDADVENLVRRSYPYVALFNVNNKFALKQGGWNMCDADTKLKDHTMREIARPNNDSLYISCLLDLRAEPMVMTIPSFDSDYVSLMITAYDHYVNVPMSTRLGDFAEPEIMLVYSARGGGYDAQPVEGVDRYFEATGDFVSAVFRVMPHANQTERFDRIVEQMQDVTVRPLSALKGAQPRPAQAFDAPSVGKTDADIFGTNLAEVMQFVFNHTSFDPADSLDRAVLEAWKPLGVVPGADFVAENAPALDGDRFREVAEQVWKAEMARATDPAFMAENALGLFRTKGNMTLERLVLQSVLGPIGLPAVEAVYPPVQTLDGKPMNALNDYVVRMPADGLPPAMAFWSLTLYDTRNGFFIPNDRKKYSVGQNAGMKLDDDGGIAIFIAAEQPEGVPVENWLPIQRKDENIDVILRIYVPDLEKFQTWTTPKAERLP